MEKRITEHFARGHVAYPQLEGEEKSHEIFNAFYRTLRDAAVSYMDEIGPASLYTADYTLKQEENILTVEYTLRLRRRGRVIQRKAVTHRWEDGYLIPPGKKREKKRKIRLMKRGKKDII